MTATLTRRAALFAAAALPAATLIGRPALAAAEMQGASNPVFNRFKMGGF